MAISSNNLKGKKVILGLSGGVDSAVAALLLRQQGADVQALHMTNWEDDDGYCTAAADLQDARHVCEQLDLPLHHANFARQFATRSFTIFLTSTRPAELPTLTCSAIGRSSSACSVTTPSDLAEICWQPATMPGSILPVAMLRLLKGADPGKDQSYFLHAVSAEALAETIFPLGDLLKTDVRRIAHDHGLAVHNKKDSNRYLLYR